MERGENGRAYIAWQGSRLAYVVKTESYRIWYNIYAMYGYVVSVLWCIFLFSLFFFSVFLQFVHCVPRSLGVASFIQHFLLFLFVLFSYSSGALLALLLAVLFLLRDSVLSHFRIRLLDFRLFFSCYFTTNRS